MCIRDRHSPSAPHERACLIAWLVACLLGTCTTLAVHGQKASITRIAGPSASLKRALFDHHGDLTGNLSTVSDC
eukprot:7211181-Alexandrium_andersonii.AAC.1